MMDKIWIVRRIFEVLSLILLKKIHNLLYIIFAVSFKVVTSEICTMILAIILFLEAILENRRL